MEGIHREGSIETRGLASQSRPEGRILCHPHRSDPQNVPQMSSSGENIPVYVSTFRAVIGPVGIHQDAEASTGPSSRDGHASGSLYRRHSDPCGVQGDGPQSRGRYGIPTRMSGLCDQQRQIGVHSEPDDRIPGPNDRYNQHGVTTSASQNKNDSGGVSKIAEGRNYLCAY